MDKPELFASAMGAENGTGYRLSRAIGAAFPDKAVLEISETFDLDELVAAGFCEATLLSSTHPEMHTQWTRRGGLRPWLVNGVYEVTRGGAVFTVARASWPEGYRTRVCWYVIGEDRAAVDEFTAAACEICNEPRQAVLAFRGGCWSRDREIYKSIQSASFDDLVLAGDMAREIREDFTSFLQAKEEYARYGVPWKRGVLFLGPPGNGKTHCLRATLNLLGVPCLYVQSLKAHYETDDANIARVFDRAREVTPCCLVFEDLDAMITSENRSTFLNQLDGFANASGILTLATTNHPERLDPAILERPSRFDRKYHFALPEEAERRRYFATWRARLDAAMQITEEQTDALVTETEGFSFAYLKELVLSAMIRWMKEREPDSMNKHLCSQLQTLREQMRTEPAAVASASKPSLEAIMPFLEAFRP